MSMLKLSISQYPAKRTSPVTHKNRIGAHSWKSKATLVLLISLISSLVRLSAFSAPASAAVYTINSYGFDACGLPNTSQMQTWWNSSPYAWVGAYLGGSDLGSGCTTPSASWVKTVSGQGWYIEPLWVGPQDPCWGNGGAEFPLNNATADFNQGETQAADAYSALSNDGFSPTTSGNTTIVYDLEGYSNGTGCIAAAQAFIKGWDTELGYAPSQVVGVYGAAESTYTSYIQDLTGSPDPQFIWGADYDSNPSTTDLYGIPAGDWDNNQRLKQYEGDQRPNYGGVSLLVDVDNADGPAFH
jgi:hypothetical protein